MEFSNEQLGALEALRGERNVVITGVAGCGKSTVLRKWMAEDAPAGTVVCAPTGVAALNVGGMTIHRLFGFHPRTSMHKPAASRKAAALLECVSVIVIDEISMVRGDVFGAMDKVLRQIKRNNLPFGGVRIVALGDFWQLPPVVRNEEADYMGRVYGSRAGWVFMSPAWKALNPDVRFLRHSFRQAGDSDFAALLNGVRNADASVIDALNTYGRRTTPEGTPFLCARKAACESYNREALFNFPEIATFTPEVFGDASKLPREVLEPLQLADGCRVMITRNGAGYVNGSVGTLRGFDATARNSIGELAPAVTVELDSGEHVHVPKETAEVVEYQIDADGHPEPVVIASVKHYPVALGYAWTIHKSQGQTLDRACVALGAGAFAHGQTYVALSRLTSAEGLYLPAPITAYDLIVDSDVINYFGGMA